MFSSCLQKRMSCALIKIAVAALFSAGAFAKSTHGTSLHPLLPDPAPKMQPDAASTPFLLISKFPRRGHLPRARAAAVAPNFKEPEDRMLEGKSIWNNTWVNFTLWHPAGVASNVNAGKISWANVGFMNLQSLFYLCFFAYPGALIPFTIFGAIGVGLRLEFATEPDAGDCARAAHVDNLTPASRWMHKVWCHFCCAIPSLLVFGVVSGLIALSASVPQEVFTITLIISSAFVFMNGVYMALFGPAALAQLQRNMGMSASQVLSQITADKQQSIRHWVIFPSFKEDREILAAAIASVARSTLAKSQIGIILAMEEREGEEANQKSDQLSKEFKGEFLEFVTCIHPSNLPNDPPGKASNVAFAYKWLAQHVTMSGYDPLQVMITVADADSEFHELYFESTTTMYFKEEPELRGCLIWQSAVLHVKNYHRQPGPVLVGTIFTGMGEISCLCDPNAARFPYSTYTLTMALANAVGGWDPEWIAEDWHMGLKCFLFTYGKSRVQPVFLPTLNYAPEEDTWLGTVYGRFTQAKRHALGFSDLAYYFMMLPLIFVHLNSTKRSGSGMKDFWTLIFNGIPYLIKFVNTHAVLGIMSLYMMLDVILRNMMLLIAGRSVAGLFERTAFATSMFAVSSIITTTIVTLTFQVLYRIMVDRLEKPPSPVVRWMFNHPIVHFFMTTLSFIICGPFHFLSLGYAVWLAAFKLLGSRTFAYDVAAKPSTSLRGASAKGDAADPMIQIESRV